MLNIANIFISLSCVCHLFLHIEMFPFQLDHMFSPTSSKVHVTCNKASPTLSAVIHSSSWTTLIFIHLLPHQLSSLPGQRLASRCPPASLDQGAAVCPAPVSSSSPAQLPFGRLWPGQYPGCCTGPTGSSGGHHPGWRSHPASTAHGSRQRWSSTPGRFHAPDSTAASASRGCTSPLPGLATTSDLDAHPWHLLAVK